MRVGLLILVGCLFGWTPGANGQVAPAPDAPQPLTPHESQQRFQLPDGFRIELVASEPLLADPSAMLIDHAGRFFVCELHGYNVEGHLDVVRLNETGELDREVRRVRVEGEVLEEAKRYRTGTVKQLVDQDGDGQMDVMSVWADDLPACYGMVAYQDGLIVVCGPDIVFLADRNDDGKAEVRERLFTGFEAELMERAINNPLWGLDGWVYVATGNSSPTASGPHLGNPIALGRSDFRFRPDGTAIESIAGTNGTFGHCFNDAGDRFLISTTTPVIFALPLPRASLARNPYIPTPAESIGASSYHDNFPTSKPHPWRAARGADPNWVKFYGPQETRANGNFTSGCSPIVYRATSFPPEYQGNHFCCDPSNNLVHRAIVRRDGAGYRGERADNEVASEFLTSTDQWCCPINLYLGPDGALYVVDMYREIIEDYSAIPRFLQQQYGLIAGHDRGRIWRLVHETGDSTPRRNPDLRELPNRQLVTLLSDTNAWWREHAQRLLRERQATDATELLVELATRGASPVGRLHALYTLDGLANGLDLDTIVSALRDTDPAVRRHALRLAESSIEHHPELLQHIQNMIDDPDEQVRLQVALSMGASTHPNALDGLVQMSIRHGGEQWMASAIVSSSVDRSHLVARDVLRHPIVPEQDFPERLDELLELLAACVGARRQPAELEHLLSTIADQSGTVADSRRVVLLRGLVDGLKRSHGPVKFSQGMQPIELLILSTHVDVVRLTFDVTKRLDLDESALMTNVIQRSSELALQAERGEDERIAAVRLLANADWQQRLGLAALLNPRQSPKLQIAAIESIAARADGPVADRLVEHWPDVSVAAQEAIIDVCFAESDRIVTLLDALERGAIPANMLGALRRAQLLSQENELIRQRAELLFGKATDDQRLAVVTHYHEALQLERDSQRGRALFDKHCAQCHRLQDRGFSVGPDLSGAAGRADLTLITDVLAPSSNVKPGYGVVTVHLDDGRSIAGLLAEESATSVTIRREQGAQEVLLRKNIEEMRMSNRSLMPDGLEQELTPQDMANLLGYLRDALGPVRATGVVLFDEEEGVINQLRQGDGVIELSRDDRAIGDFSMRVTPLQRSNARIDGWNFAIVEQPQPGEYRYLRWRWKSAEADGVMIELAGDGSWPPAESPVRRYFAGKNTTDWQAQRVGVKMPEQWTEVTVDLFKDNGPFTLTGFAPTAMGGPVLFDRIELLRALDETAR